MSEFEKIYRTISAIRDGVERDCHIRIELSSLCNSVKIIVVGKDWINSDIDLIVVKISSQEILELLNNDKAIASLVNGINGLI